jgi:hypothetical protein
MGESIIIVLKELKPVPVSLTIFAAKDHHIALRSLERTLNL